MKDSELTALIQQIQNNQWEEQTLEIKSAREKAPRLYDTLSSFSNQDEGGIILCGINESNRFQVEGVSDGKRLQDRIGEQCEEMYPVVRPKITLADVDGKTIVAAEIPGLPYDQRPCYHTKKGIEKGSYIRVGQFDKPMNSLEIFEYESYRKKHRPELDEVGEADLSILDSLSLEQFMRLKIKGRPQLAKLSLEKAAELSGLIKGEHPTKLAMLLFGMAPQLCFPEFVIQAVVHPTNEPGVSSKQIRFLDNLRIEGTLQEMAETAFLFLQRNLKVRTCLNGTGTKNDLQLEIPEIVLREVIINALIHRDYSQQAETMPIRIEIFPDRIEIKNPGSLYGGMSVSSLGNCLFPVRNPQLVSSFELMSQTENRGSGIPTIRQELKQAGLPEATFISRNAQFTVILYRDSEKNPPVSRKAKGKIPPTPENILSYCQTPRSRQELIQHFGYKSTTSFVNHHVKPLIEQGKILLAFPEDFSSRHQKFETAQKNS